QFRRVPVAGEGKGDFSQRFGEGKEPLDGPMKKSLKPFPASERRDYSPTSPGGRHRAGPPFWIGGRDRGFGIVPKAVTGNSVLHWRKSVGRVAGLSRSRFFPAPDGRPEDPASELA